MSISRGARGRSPLRYQRGRIPDAPFLSVLIKLSEFTTYKVCLTASCPLKHTEKFLMALRLSHQSASPTQPLPALAVRRTAHLDVSALLVDPLPRSAPPPSPGPDRLLGPCPAHVPQ